MDGNFSFLALTTINANAAENYDVKSSPVSLRILNWSACMATKSAMQLSFVLTARPQMIMTVNEMNIILMHQNFEHGGRA